MSHAAVNWALEQRGLKPSAKLVLICLADRHNKDTGECFPSQDLLASDACLSRSSLNDQLTILETLGYFTRETIFNPRTHKRENTQYNLNLGFTPEAPESDGKEKAMSEIRTRKNDRAMSEKGPKPCPKKADSHVRNSDNNPVRLTRKLTGETAADFGQGFWEDLLSALGLSPSNLPDRWKGDQARKDVAQWIALGLTEARIIEIARISREKHPQPPQGPKALNARMEAAAKAPVPAQPASRQEFLTTLAGHINGEGYVAPSACSASTAQELLQARLVTRDALRARGIAA